MFLKKMGHCWFSHTKGVDSEVYQTAYLTVDVKRLSYLYYFNTRVSCCDIC